MLTLVHSSASTWEGIGSLTWIQAAHFPVHVLVKDADD